MALEEHVLLFASFPFYECRKEKQFSSMLITMSLKLEREIAQSFF